MAVCSVAHKNFISLNFEVHEKGLGTHGTQSKMKKEPRRKGWTKLKEEGQGLTKEWGLAIWGWRPETWQHVSVSASAVLLLSFFYYHFFFTGQNTRYQLICRELTNILNNTIQEVFSTGLPTSTTNTGQYDIVLTNLLRTSK